MIIGFTIVQGVYAALVGLVCVVLGLAGRKPNDLTVLSVAAIELLLVAQAVVAIVAPFAGNTPTGNPLEFWMYLISALIIPPLAIVWSLVERTRWSNVVLGAAAFAIAVMLWRMEQIWSVQLAG
ncbi:hypothetical protein [Protaetiibacter intestinalis]|uniref:Integral membrane protein n=1 Tax=Protaetiibacter intestinalis TaxID=2419774 RepID=A0A387B922_9MICO|nr:hypothetical protein [Protaetiibacter intestinalis]AYF98867.1 hypothetical protein D7I47_11795 [Protaetiibacter intestinalis]